MFLLGFWTSSKAERTYSPNRAFKAQNIQNPNQIIGILDNWALKLFGLGLKAQTTRSGFWTHLLEILKHTVRNWKVQKSELSFVWILA